MKKLLVTLVITMALVLVPNVKAMSESDLYAKFSKTYNINGVNFKLKESDLVLVKRYLDTYEVSSTDADYIAGKIDQAVQALRDSGATNFDDFSKLPASTRSTLKGYVSDIASNTSVKATVIKGNVVIYNPDGTVFAEIGDLVKPTGANVNVILIASLLITVSSVIVLVKKSHA